MGGISFNSVAQGFKNAGKAVSNGVKNIGKGISHAYKAVARAGSKLLKSPIVKGLILAAAIYFSAGTLGPMVGAALGASGTTAAVVGTAVIGAATNVAVTGLAGNASMGDLSKAAGQGAVAGAVGGYAAAPSSAATQAGSTATQAGSTATQNIANAAIDLPPAATASPSIMSQGVGLMAKGADWAAAHPQITKMGLDAVTAANTPNQIDIANNQARLDNQARINRINGNQVPVDNGGVGLMGYGATINGQLNPSAQNQVMTPSQQQIINSNPALQYNAALYQQQY